MDAANGAATATISNGGTPVAPTDRTAVDTLVSRNITDHTAPDATALRECHFGEQQQYPRQRCEQAGEKSALVGHGAIIAARRVGRRAPTAVLETQANPPPQRPNRTVGFFDQSEAKFDRPSQGLPGRWQTPPLNTDPLRWFLCR